MVDSIYSLSKNLYEEIHDALCQDKAFILVEDQKTHEIVLNKVFFPKWKRNLQDQMKTAKTLLAIGNRLQKKPSGFTEDQVNTLVSCAYSYIRRLEALPKASKTELEQLKSESLSQVLGGAIEAKTLLSEIKSNSIWMQVIMKNQIHYKMQHLGLKQDLNEAAFKVENVWIPMRQIEIQENENEIHFKKGNQLLFKTDKKFRMIDHFFCGERGIVSGKAMSNKGLEGIQKRNPTGKHWIWAFSAVNNPLTPQFQGDHTYLGLEDKGGNLTIAGQYGVEDDLNASDVVTMFSHKNVGIESPDRYSGLPLSRYKFKATKFEITESEYDRLKEEVNQDIQNGLKGSLLDSNCTKYVTNKLESVGLHPEYKITTESFLIRNLVGAIFPKMIASKITRWGRNIPKPIRYAMHFGPLFIPNLIFAIGRFLLSYESCSCVKGDQNIMTLFNAIFRPWKIDISHPVIFREWQEQFDEVDLSNRKRKVLHG